MKSNFLFNIQGMTRDIVTVYQISQICRYIQNIILSIALVKSAISLDNIGRFEIMVFLITILTQFWVSGIKDTIISKYGASQANEKNALIIDGFWGLVILGLISTFLFGVLYPFFFNAEQLLHVQPLVLYLCLYLFFGALSSYPETLLLLKNKPLILLYFSGFSTLLFFILIIIFFWIQPTLLYIILLLLALSIVKVVFLLSILPGFRMSTSGRLVIFLKRSLPFLFIAVIGYGMEMIDGFLVVHFFDVSQFPIYKYGARELPFSSLLMSSLSVALIPALTNLYKIEDLKIKVNKHMHLLFPITILLMWVSTDVFEFFYSTDFKESAFIFNIYLLILGSRLLLPHSILLAHGKQKWVLYSGILELLVNLILSLWWVHIWGLPGLIMATVAAYYTQKAVMLYLVKKHFGLKLNQFITVHWWILYQVIALVSLYIVFTWVQ